MRAERSSLTPQAPQDLRTKDEHCKLTQKHQSFCTSYQNRTNRSTFGPRQTETQWIAIPARLRRHRSHAEVAELSKTGGLRISAWVMMDSRESAELLLLKGLEPRSTSIMVISPSWTSSVYKGQKTPCSRVDTQEQSKTAIKLDLASAMMDCSVCGIWPTERVRDPKWADM